MPVIKVNDQQFSLRPGPNRLGAGEGVDVAVADNSRLGVQAIVDVAGDSRAVIRRAGAAASVRVNGVPLVDPTPLMHGDRLEIGGREVYYTDDGKTGNTQFVAPAAVADAAARRTGTARPTMATGGRLVSCSTARNTRCRQTASRSGETRLRASSSLRTKSRASTLRFARPTADMRSAISARTAST